MAPASELRALVTAGVAVAAVACGGKAIIDPMTDGSGGAGASSSGTFGATTGPVPVSVVASTSTGMVEPDCAAACASLGECGDVFDCEGRCDRISDECRDLHEAWLTCSFAAAGTMCGAAPGQECQGPLAQYLACEGNMLNETCSALEDGACYCEDFSVGPFSQLCVPGEGCDCFYGDGVIGRCEPEEEACGIYTGCCAGVFFAAPWD